MENMRSLPTVVDPQDYHQQAANNDSKITEMFEALFPDIPTPMVYDVARIVSYLSETQVNPQLLPRVIRGVHNILIGTGKGQVIVHVKETMTNVSVRETDEGIKAVISKK